ncbi:hypothetical protein LCGC14_0562970 [marine sediment metagenome]|uniref:Uncharacterized protein n=1 Tax=marine sediment metagenome TaxID=412755 RepID=A0A0F9RLE8_9ZZZZ|nr:hypothetical protein [Phycisphaerae bacterium]HDZ44650.1 hypothetical protein [Phycisphaerae bacterium]
MLTADAQLKAEWNYKVVLFALAVGWLVQNLLLDCLCDIGQGKMKIATAVDVLILIRILIARLIHERNKGWVFYAALPFIVIPVIAWVIERHSR